MSKKDKEIGLFRIPVDDEDLSMRVDWDKGERAPEEVIGWMEEEEEEEGEEEKEVEEEKEEEEEEEGEDFLMDGIVESKEW